MVLSGALPSSIIFKVLPRGRSVSKIKSLQIRTLQYQRDQKINKFSLKKRENIGLKKRRERIARRGRKDSLHLTSYKC